MQLVFLFFITIAAVVNGRETIINKIGHLHFFDQTEALNFNIELKQFFEHGKLYDNIANKIIIECNKLPNATCDSETKNIQNHQLRSKQMIEYVSQEHKMRKRRWAFLWAAIRIYALRYLAVTSLCVGSSAMTSYAVVRSAQAEERYNTEVIEDAFERNLNNSRNSYEISQENQREENLSNLQREYYDKLKAEASDVYSSQRLLYDIFSDISEGNAHKRFFEIISVTDFVREIGAFKSTLPEGLMFPRGTPTTLLDLSMISYVKNDTRLINSKSSDH